MLLDANGRKLTAYDEFVIEMIGFGTPHPVERVPVCLITGLRKGLFGLRRRTVLGFYATLEDAQQELRELSNASSRSTSYTLKYAAKLNVLHIVEN